VISKTVYAHSDFNAPLLSSAIERDVT